MSTKTPLQIMYSWVRLRVRIALGTLFNLAGIPGLIRDCDYESGVADASVKVRVRDLFTVVEVNGLEIFFHRLTGTIDGVGVTGCKLDLAPAPIPSLEEPELEPGPFRR